MLIIQVVLTFILLAMFGIFVQIFFQFFSLDIWIVIPTSTLVWFFTAIFFLAFVHRICRFFLRDKTGVLEGSEVFWWAIAATTFDIAINLIRIVFFHSTIPHFFFRLFGMKIGKNSTVLGRIFDPELIEIGNNTLVGTFAILGAHVIQNGKIYRERIRIGDNCTIGGQVFIYPGVIIEDNCLIGGNSVVPKGKRLDAGIWVGIPVKKIKDA